MSLLAFLSNAITALRLESSHNNALLYSLICSNSLDLFLCSLPDVVDDGVLEPGHPEVQPLGVDLVLDAAEAGEDDGAVTTLNYKEGKGREGRDSSRGVLKIISEI